MKNEWIKIVIALAIALVLFVLLSLGVLYYFEDRLSKEEAVAHEELLDRLSVEESSVVITGEAPRPTVKYLSCEDSDLGKTYSTRGYVRVKINYYGETKTEDFYDVCEGGTLKEYYCGRRNKHAVKQYSCPNVCSDGRCVSTFCGNGIKEANEGCDDGNTFNGDGCWNCK